jgi:hypothetical protein
MKKSKTVTLREFLKNNKDEFLSVPSRLNTCLHWTIWPIHMGVQCK